MTDVGRPLRIKWLQRIYLEFGAFFNTLFAVDNLDTSKSGIHNRFGYYLNQYKANLKRFKRWNKPLYVTTKIIILFAVLTLIFAYLRQIVP